MSNNTLPTGYYKLSHRGANVDESVAKVLNKTVYNRASATEDGLMSTTDFLKVKNMETTVQHMIDQSIPPLPQGMVIDENYVHTDNNYTLEDKLKVNQLESNTRYYTASEVEQRIQEIHRGEKGDT